MQFKCKRHRAQTGKRSMNINQRERVNYSSKTKLISISVIIFFLNLAEHSLWRLLRLACKHWHHIGTHQSATSKIKNLSSLSIYQQIKWTCMYHRFQLEETYIKFTKMSWDKLEGAFKLASEQSGHNLATI